MNADTLRRLAAIDMPAEALREVVRVFADAVASEEERKAKDAQKSALYRSRGGGKIPLDLRKAVYERDAYSCVYCAATENLECDHVVAVSRGGATTLENLATACKSCNSRKRDRDRKFVQRHSVELPRTNGGQDVEVRGNPAQRAQAPAREEVLTSLDSNNLPTKETPKGVSKGKVSRFKTLLSEEAQPTSKDRDVAEREGMSAATFRLEWQKFRGHHVSEGTLGLNWHQSWVKWVSNWVSYGRKQADAPPARAGPNGNKPLTFAEMARMEFTDEPRPSPPDKPKPTSSDDSTIIGFAGRLPQPDRDHARGQLLDLGSADARWRA